ncbi:MauE/DoxX family redox-associated membrane protein [Flavobacterium johnsoniae]|uniref:Methylamine utilisation protein MauE domain-containing protein n=1 Tax=Flavobacterium johnsoniae (strain ATCC 17061 / DSM 2064 / JCM 8514 / BCRC 14874 / CCUG 350202 / NBRC 14942 / NCIMB 11054 / UW101) TaxID=376686 RepID=A5FDZ5_FLAJ1|nr:MauE/DoxX family redox-associated membrane protein [Flavobacterium johnsoniae]ABQ06574.1 hypothetical protein Fjoh_3560 [Flavobacterium johnsoniae UW101]OXE99809.1 hypothetical protein B0A63_10935 [Flavobacterium johnsoniae UW101]WQG82324.1 hypothetical protein SR927_04235 [Flavobacterium johnsoniae UW101]SHK79970.1 hypothetical protein SAMN05444146_2311 [Flavobacterium johnsoniae]
MKVQFNFRSAVIEIICMLYVLLFVYAATSKLLDFQHFKIELGQSPLLSAFAEWIAVLVPAAEYITCLLLIIPRFRLTGLFLAYGLMVMFTVYIFIILNYTSFVPCSCGGVLEKLDWKSHMIFNLVFVCLAVLGILLHVRRNKMNGHQIKRVKIIRAFSAVTVCGICIVSILFIISENIIHYHNKLTRRFPQTPIQQEAVADLKLNSFYIAGVDDSHVYLGNTTAPLLVTTLNTRLFKTDEKMIDLARKDLPFRAVKISVQSPYFFVTDGTIPVVFRGRIQEWKAKLVFIGGEYFTTALALDSLTVAVVTNNSKTGDNVLGTITVGKNGKTILNPLILQKQVDGVFDTDGHLLYSKAMDKVVFLYYYRNQFTIADKSLKITDKGTTIDTITKAQLNIVRDKKHHQRKFSSPPLFVNKNCSLYRNLLFVNSAIPGRYEDDRIWKEASIIDVYNLNDKSYLMSFCIYNLEGKKMKSFTVLDDKIYVLVGTKIIRYKIGMKITSKYITKDK